MFSEKAKEFCHKNKIIFSLELGGLMAGTKYRGEMEEKLLDAVEYVKEVNGILFIDEIHRFNKSQQDSLLNAVEKGLVILIGATTENPSFEVISPLLSRCQIYVMKPLEKDDLEKLISTATAVLENDYGKKIVFEEKEALMHISGGDARKLLNAIDLVVGMMAEVNPDAETLTITNEITTQYIQSNLLKYDRLGEMHYDIISAFIKSMRGEL